MSLLRGMAAENAEETFGMSEKAHATELMEVDFALRAAIAQEKGSKLSRIPELAKVSR